MEEHAGHRRSYQRTKVRRIPETPYKEQTDVYRIRHLYMRLSPHSAFKPRLKYNLLDYFLTNFLRRLLIMYPSPTACLMGSVKGPAAAAVSLIHR